TIARLSWHPRDYSETVGLPSERSSVARGRPAAAGGAPSSVVVTGAILSHDDDGVRRSRAPRSREARVGRPSSRHNGPASIMRAMGVRVHVGTGDGLWELDGDRACPVEWLSGKSLTALAGDGPRTWAIVGGRMLCESAGVLWEERAAIEGPPATCLMPTP